MSQIDFDPRTREGVQVGIWELGKTLGMGGMASVYESTSPYFGVAAVKVLHPALLTNSTVCKRFFQEYEILKGFSHPGSITVFDSGTSEAGEPYYSMELLDGKVLSAIWRDKGHRLRASIVLELVAHLLEVLQALHDQRILHRDIKPSNVWVCRDRTVRLLDMGVARIEETAGDLTQTGTALGTPAFMSPEQARGLSHQVDERSDLFSVGALMFSLLAGQKLRAGRTSEEALVLAATQPVDSILRFVPNLDPNVAHIIDRALSWYPDQRYSSAQEMLDAIIEVRAFGLDATSGAPGLSGLSEPTAAPPRRPVVPKVEKPPSRQFVPGESELAHFGKGNDEQDEVVGGVTLPSMISDCFRAFQLLIDARRLYGWHHAEVDRRLEQSFERVSSTLQFYPHRFTFAIRPNRIEAQGEPVWEPEKSFAEIPFFLFTSGFRFVTIRPQVTLPDLSAFLRLISSNPKTDFPPEDDFATAFWDLDLPTIDVQLAAVYRVSEDPETQAEFDEAVEEAKLGWDRLAEWASLQAEQIGILSSLGDNADAEAKGEVLRAGFLEAASKGALSPQFRQQFLKSVGLSSDYEERSAWVLANAWSEVSSHGDANRLERPAMQMLRTRLEVDDFAGVSQFLRNLSRAVPDRDHKRSLAEACFGEINTLSAVKRVLIEPEPESEVAEAFGRFLAVGDPSSMGLIAENLLGGNDITKVALLTYIARNLEGFAAIFGENVKSASPKTARYFLEIASRSRAPESIQILGGCGENPDLAIRQEGFEAMISKFPDSCGKYLGIFIQDESLEIRVRALQHAASHSFPDIIGVLARVANQSAFQRGSFTERRLVIETLFNLDRAKGELAAISILSNAIASATGGKEAQTTRTLALRLLGEYGTSPEGFAAIEHSAKWRPSNSGRVRDAAKAAMKRWEQRN